MPSAARSQQTPLSPAAAARETNRRLALAPAPYRNYEMAPKEPPSHANRSFKVKPTATGKTKTPDTSSALIAVCM